MSVVGIGKVCAMMVACLAVRFPGPLEIRFFLIALASSIIIQFEHFWVLLLSNAKIRTEPASTIVSTIPESVVVLELVKVARPFLIYRASVCGVDQLTDLICHINYVIMSSVSAGDFPCNTHSQLWSPYACVVAHHCKKINHHNQFLIDCK